MRARIAAGRSIAFVALLVVAIADARAGGGNLPDSGFAGQVREYFAVWDYNRDGYLSFLETAQLIPVTAIRGEEAAAIAAIHRIQRGSRWNQAPFTMAELLASDPPSASWTGPAFVANYLDCLAHIRATERVLFPRGGPSLLAFHQGALGDCYFVAVVGAVVDRSPGVLTQMVRSESVASFDVTFADREAVRVRHLSDAEIALGSSVGGHGLWLNVLEKAFGQMAEEVRQLGGGTREDAIDAVAQGGQATRSMRLFTGHEARTYLLRPDGATAPPTDAQAAALVPGVSAVLAENVRLKRLTTCDTDLAAEVPGIAPRHAYAVLGFDAAGGMVHVWNPWGDDFAPSGAPGRASGYPVKGGHFFVPVADFVRIFAALHCETNIPARIRW